MHLPRYELNSLIPPRGGENLFLNLTSSAYWYRRRGGGWLLHPITLKDTHTQSDSFGRRIGPSQRPLPDNTRTHRRQTFMPPDGIQTRSFSKPAAIEPRLRPRGHGDRQRVFSSPQCRDRLWGSPITTPQIQWAFWVTVLQMTAAWLSC
jgi:hypothetical protein